MSIRDRAGFTLVEAAVALLIVSGVLAAAFAVQAAELGARRRAESVALAAALLDDLHARAELLSAAEIEKLAGASDGRFPPPMERFSWRLQASRVAEDPGLVELSMAVSWGSGALRAVSRIAPPAPVRP